MAWLLAGVSGTSLALIVAASAGAQATPLSERTFNEQVLRPSGQPVIPLYEGYYPNPDGTYEICFGYFNLNTEEDVNIPLGPNNMIEPVEFDGMQPTHFDRVPLANYRRRFCIFTVNVPADFGDREVVWTLNRNDEAISTLGKVLPSYVLDELVADGRGVVAPVLRFEVDGPEFRAAVDSPERLSLWRLETNCLCPFGFNTLQIGAGWHGRCIRALGGLTSMSLRFGWLKGMELHGRPPASANPENT